MNDIEDPSRCLLLEVFGPEHPRTSKAHAFQIKWDGVAHQAWSRGAIKAVAEEDVFRPRSEPVYKYNGARGVDKSKTLDATTTRYFCFISICSLTVST